MAPAGAAGITGSGSSDYGEWAREVCDILERSLVQFETISVSGDDLAGFFRSASANAGSVAKELAGVKAASGTGVFMTEAAATFEALVPLLSRAGNELEAAATGPEALQAMGAVLAAREPEINAVLERVRVSAKADLPPEAVRALSQTQPCGSVYRP